MRSSHRLAPLPLMTIAKQIIACSLMLSPIGCASLEPHTTLRTNTDALITRINDSANPTVPRNQALFCLDRAIENLENARNHTGLDMTLLIGSATAGLAGLTFQSLGSALPTPSDPDTGAKKGFEVAGITTLAFAAALLTVRTAAGQSDIALAQRTAAAKQVDASFRILIKYAMAEDPKEVTDDGFSVCTDADISVANAYPGASAGDELNKKLNDARAAETEAKQAAKQAEKAVMKQDEEVAEAKELVAQKQAELEAASSKVNELKTTPVKKDALEQAMREEEKLRAEKAAADAALTKAQASAKETRDELACKAAKAETENNRLAVLTRAAELRRATFFLTKKDVEIATNELTTATEDLKQSRTSQSKACVIAAPGAPEGQP